MEYEDITRPKEASVVDPLGRKRLADRVHSQPKKSFIRRDSFYFEPFSSNSNEQNVNEMNEETTTISPSFISLISGSLAKSKNIYFYNNSMKFKKFYYKMFISSKFV